MAIDYWQDMSILDGGYELAGHGKNVTLATTVAPLDATPISVTDDSVVLIGGIKSGTIDLSLMADGSAGWELHSFDNLGVAGIPKSVVTRSADGSVAFLMRGITLGYTPVEGAPGDLAMAQVNGASSGVLARGRLLHPSNVSRTSSGTGTGRQLGAVVAGKSLYAALHVISASGTTPTLDVKVQSDDNPSFTSATDRITFTQRTTTGTYDWGSVAGAITDDYWRITYTLGGTNPSFAFAVTAGIL